MRIPFLSSISFLVALTPLAVAGDIFVDPTLGVDAAGNGSLATSPVKTLSFASSMAIPGDLIHLAAGVYDSASGEVLPIMLHLASACRVQALARRSYEPPARPWVSTQ